MALVKRSDKKAFWGIPATGSGTATFNRMKGFTTISGSKNAKEYSRQYVDEAFEQSDVTGYSPSYSLSFDEITGNSVHADLVSIIDGEKIGSEAEREVIFVDFSAAAESGAYPAVKRTFTVIADSEGDSTDAYGYSCTIKSKSSAIVGTAAITTPTSGTPENVETVTFTAAE